MRLAAHLALILLAILLAVVLPQTMFWMACVLAIASLQWSRSLVSAFFLLAAIHCVLGYGMAFKGEDSIYWLATGQQVWFAKAALAIALGLFSMATAYRFSKHSQSTWLNGLSVDEDHMRNLTRAAVVIAALAMFYMYAGFSVIDLALQNLTEVGKLRYLGSESAVDAYMVIRVSDVLVCTLPLLWLMRQKKIDYLIYLIGFIALLLPLRRASIFAVLLLPVLVRFQSINFRKLAVLFLVLLAIYGLSQIALMTVYDYDVLSSAASALPEVRDLGWAMELLRGNYLYGATVIQPLDPFPGLIDTWKKTHSISYITAELLNVDPESRSFGGLRITMAGEAFLNLWFFGPVLFGLALGWGTAWAERSMDHATNLITRYLSVTAFAWICFWIYMGGTQAAPTIKVELILFAAMYLLARKRAVAEPGTVLQPAVS